MKKMGETNVGEKGGKIRFSIGDLNGEREQCLNLKANLYVLSSYHISLDDRSQ